MNCLKRFLKSNQQKLCLLNLIFGGFRRETGFKISPSIVDIKHDGRFENILQSVQRRLGEGGYSGADNV